MKRWILVPTREGRDNLAKVIVRSKKYNYVMGWKDVRGFGLYFSNCEWAGQSAYVNLRDG